MAHVSMVGGNSRQLPNRAGLPARAKSSSSHDHPSAGPLAPPSPPKYHKDDKAAMVLANPYFYQGSQEIADMFQKDRASVLGDKTVEQVFCEFALGGHNDKVPREMEKCIDRGLNYLGQKTKCDIQLIKDYFADATYTHEDVFVARKIIDLSWGAEKEIFVDRAVENIPMVHDVLSTTLNRVNGKGETRRDLPLAFVLGCSGSGKTFFSLQQLAKNFLNNNNNNKLRAAAVYLYADDIFGAKLTTDANAAKEVIKGIKAKIQLSTGLEIKEELDMHLNIIIDEAGSYGLRAWFEDREMVTNLCVEAKGLAKSVGVILTGTGFTARNFDSINDAYVFRMKQWQVSDLAMLFDRHKEALRLVENKETTLTVANAVYAHPKMGALATNARAAYFLVKSVTNLSALFHRVPWSTWLDQWSSVIVPKVFDDYRCSNSLSRLDADQRRRVAACVFLALEDLQEGEVTVSSFSSELDFRDTARADIVMQWNVELVEGELRLVEGENFSMTVTPAITLILYSMVGIHPVLLPPWRADEEIAAYFAVRQWLLRGIHDFIVNKDELRYASDRTDRFNHFLRKVHLVLLKKPLEPSMMSALVPMVGSGAVLVNCEEASFANIIAPYTLIVTKQVSDCHMGSTILDVDLDVELQKCCLVKMVSHDETQLLEGLLAV